MKLDRFEEIIKLKHAVTITPKYPPYDTILGFPLAVSQEMVLLHEVMEFHLGGYAVVPLPEIAVRSKKAERTVERILHEEGILQKIGIKDELPLEEFEDLFRALQRSRRLVMVEFFDTHEAGYADEAFVCGKITGMTARSVAVLNFNAAGEWDSEATVVGYDQIKRIRFDTEYINVFAKYLA